MIKVLLAHYRVIDIYLLYNLKAKKSLAPWTTFLESKAKHTRFLIVLLLPSKYIKKLCKIYV